MILIERGCIGYTLVLLMYVLETCNTILKASFIFDTFSPVFYKCRFLFNAYEILNSAAG